MAHNRRVHPMLSAGNVQLSETNKTNDQRDIISHSSHDRIINNDTTSLMSSSDGSSYLKLKPFKMLDPTLQRLLLFLACFGVTVNFVSEKKIKTNQIQQNQSNDLIREETTSEIGRLYMFMKIGIMFVVCALSMEVVLDLDFTQSKLITEQKRAAPLLTFVIVGYSVTALIIPIISDGFLIFIGSHLFRFYSRTTTTVCNGKWSTLDDMYCSRNFNFTLRLTLITNSSLNRSFFW